MKSKLEKDLNKNKIFDFKGLLKNFFSASQEELSEEEVILSDTLLTEQEKKELIDGLSTTETLAHKLFSNNIKGEKNIKRSKNPKIKESEKINVNNKETNQINDRDRDDD